MQGRGSGAHAEHKGEIEESWKSERWAGITRGYSAEDVIALRGSILVDHTIAKIASEKRGLLLHTEPHVAALGASGNQAVQMVQAGLKAIYMSGWQVAADANLAGQTYPDLSLYPSNSVPSLVRRVNQALLRADQIDHLNGRGTRDWLAPIVADAEAGFGGPLNVFELMKGMIEAGAAGVHFEDQLSSEKKCGHMGGKVLVPTSQFIRTLTVARLAADVLGVRTLIIARTDARDSNLLTNDIDSRDRRFMTGGRKGRPKDTSGYGMGLSWPSAGHWIMRPTLTCSGLRRRSLASRKRGSSPRQSTPVIRTSFSPTTCHLRSTGTSLSRPRSRKASSPSSECSGKILVFKMKRLQASTP